MNEVVAWLTVWGLIWFLIALALRKRVLRKAEIRDYDSAAHKFQRLTTLLDRLETLTAETAATLADAHTAADELRESLSADED